MATAAERQRAFRARLKVRGLSPFTLYVRSSDVGELAALQRLIYEDDGDLEVVISARSRSTGRFIRLER